MKLIETVDDRLSALVENRAYRRLKTSSRYNHHSVNELHKTVRRAAVEIAERTFFGKEPMSDFAFLQELKSVRDTCRILEGRAI